MEILVKKRCLSSSRLSARVPLSLGLSQIFTWALFTSPPNPKYFLFHPLHQIFRRMHGTLNVGKKITNCIVCL
jgi:hypothetical protein